MAKDKDNERRRLLADDVRRLGGLADFTIGEARLLDAPMPDEAATCVVTWRAWAAQLAVWARGDVDT
jgi:hypothetical protein